MPAIAIGARWQGIEGAAAAVVLADAAVGIPVVILIMRLLDVGAGELGRVIMRPAVGWVALALVLVALRPLVDGLPAGLRADRAGRRRDGRLPGHRRARRPRRRRDDVGQPTRTAALGPAAGSVSLTTLSIAEERGGTAEEGGAGASSTGGSTKSRSHRSTT